MNSVRIHRYQKTDGKLTHKFRVLNFKFKHLISENNETKILTISAFFYSMQYKIYQTNEINK